MNVHLDSLLRALRPRSARQRPGRARRRTTLHLERLETRTNFDVHLADLVAIDMMAGKDQLIPLQGTDDLAQAISYTADVTSAGNAVTATVVTGGRSWRLSVSGVDGNGDAFSGELEFRFFEDSAPLATSRFIELTQQVPSFFNNIILHRVIDNFVAQGGDPTGTGSGGSPLPDFSDEFDVTNTFTSRGLLAMANSGDDTNDSQFFIVDTDLSLAEMPQHLNFNHTIFGILTKGQDVLAKIMSTVTDSNDRPLDDVTITSSEVFTDTTSGVLRIHAPEGFTGAATITVTAHNGQSGAGSTATKAVVVNVGADVWNDRAFLGPLPHRTVLEDQEITFDVTAIDLERDTINFVVGHGDDITQLVQNVDVSGFITPATSTTPTTATITFAPYANFYGDIPIALGVRDQTPRDQSGELDVLSNFDTQSFILTVIPVNDMPLFSATNPAAVTQGSGAHSVTNWAAFDPGAANETDQTATYLVTVDSGANLFTVAPAISASGTLTYTLAANASGTATFTVRVKDSGGTDNNGVDTSAPQQFSLVVNPAPQPPTAVNDVALTKTGVFIPIAALANDTHDANLDFNSLTITQAPASGVAVVNTANGTIDYTPEPGFQGTVTIKYRVSDVAARQSNEATITLRVADHPWQNSTAGDINGVGGVTNLDAFLLITDLRNNQPRLLPLPYTGSEPLVYLDPTGDDAITNLDAFYVIGLLRLPAAEGEAFGPAAASANQAVESPLVPVLETSVLLATSAPAALAASTADSPESLAAIFFAPLATVPVADDSTYATALADVVDEGPALVPDDLANDLALALTF